MKNFFCLALLCSLLFACNNQKSEDAKAASGNDSAIAPPPKPPAPAEITDARYADIGKKDLAALSSGDIDAWMTSLADNCVYLWNNGDSLAGKAAISAYWKKRRKEVIDSIRFTNQIWLPIKVNQPQATEQPGVWLLGWYQTTAKYKTGKGMMQWIHTDQHFDANDKIDRIIQYLDRASINAATKK